MNGALNRTIFPLTSFPFSSNSSKLLTTTTSAFIPPFGVAMLPPSPSMPMLFLKGRIRSKDSLPRIQVGTCTRSPLGIFSPSDLISEMIQSKAFSRLLDPLKRGPKVSQRYASLSYAVLSFIAAVIIFRESIRNSSGMDLPLIRQDIDSAVTQKFFNIVLFNLQSIMYRTYNQQYQQYKISTHRDLIPQLDHCCSYLKDRSEILSEK